MGTKVVTIANPKGGVGKSATAINIAYWLNASFIIDQDANSSISEANLLNGNEKSVKRASSIDEIYNLIMSSGDDELIVIDTGGYNSKLAQQILSLSDYIFTPSGQDVPHLIGLKNLNKMLESLNKRAFVFPSAFHKNARNFNTLINYVNMCSMLDYVDIRIDRDSEISKAANQSKSVFELFGYSTSARKYKELSNLVGVSNG